MSILFILALQFYPESSEASDEDCNVYPIRFVVQISSNTKVVYVITHTIGSIVKPHQMVALGARAEIMNK